MQSNLSEWQLQQLKLYSGRIDEADTLDKLSEVVAEFAPTRQSWLLAELMPKYLSRLEMLRDGRPPDVLLIVDQMNWVFADWSSCCDPAKASRMFGERIRMLAKETGARWVVVAAESEGPLERKKVFDGYKSSRVPPDDGVLQTASLVEQGCAHFGIPVIRQEGWEADDVAATLSTKASLRGERTVICTSDRDYCQLLKKGKVSLWRKGDYYTEDMLLQEKGLYASQYVDYLCIIGKDDVPGLHGVGDKTAIQLLEKYGNFIGICDYDHKLTVPKKKSLDEFLNFYFTAKQMHLLNRWLDIDFDWDIVCPLVRTEIKDSVA